MTTSPLRVLVAGGGVAGVEALLTLHALAGDRVDLTSPTPRRTSCIADNVAEAFGRGIARRHPMRDIARDAGAPSSPTT